ncbi:MAG: TolC family protein [Planctomycetes bacterium]|nr:TolC family protein [Planctomycetota bacterium]
MPHQISTYCRFLTAALAGCVFVSSIPGQENQPARVHFGKPIALIERVPGTPARTAQRLPLLQVRLPDMPAAQTGDRPLPINLPTALQLAGANPLDIALASQRVNAAQAELQRAKVLWLPTIYFGVDYYRHDGKLQDVVGDVFNTNKSSFMVGATPNVVFAVTDAIYSPLAAKQVVRARQADLQATRNDTLLAVAEAYFNVQQARGEVAGAADSLRRTEEMVKKIEKLVQGFSPAVEKNRALAELATRRQAVETAYERWQTASATLNRLLRLDAAALVQPAEGPHLKVDLVEPGQSVDDLIALGLTNRPELASHQALVQATLARLRREKVRPWVPSVLIRGAATNPAGSLAAGYFGGGVNDTLSNFGGRNSIDLQLLWEFQNLGLGNRALVKQREAENQQALLTLFGTQDFVAAEVVQAHAQATRAQKRHRHAEEGLKNALITVEKNLEGLQQTRNIGGVLVLVFRPFEVIAAIQSLDQAYRQFYTAVADSNRAQFRLYRAIGQPAQDVVRETARER